MTNHPIFRAVLCQLLLACGGAVGSTPVDAGPSADATAPTSGSAGDDAGETRMRDGAASNETGADADTCVTTDPARFDASCEVDTDCVAVLVGGACTQGGGCLCPAGTINASEEARYQSYLDALMESLPPPTPSGGRPCSCPFFGKPTCIAGQCTLCGGAQPPKAGCPDGG